VDLEQRFIEDDKEIIVSLECIYKLEKYSDCIAGDLLSCVERMTNEIIDDCSLGLVINDKKETLFFELEFSNLNESRVSLYNFYLISSDDYLDLMLDNNIIKFKE
jgi:hypothetical protein